MFDIEAITRKAYLFSTSANLERNIHPFVSRCIHKSLPVDVKNLFDNKHYAQATFEACKYLDNLIARLCLSSENGKSLMMTAFNESKPIIKLNLGKTESDKNEQEGYKFLFAGTIVGIRNPRGHKISVNDDEEMCLEHLSVISHLLTKLESVGYSIN